MKEYIYHYTTLENLIRILNSEFLKVSEYEKRSGVFPPALWLSKNEMWENTATKGGVNLETFEYEAFSFQKQHEHLGCVRFKLVFDEENLVSWENYGRVSNTLENVYLEMGKIGIECGSNPTDWYVSFNDIHISEIEAIEIWGGESWIDYGNDLDDGINYHLNRLNL